MNFECHITIPASHSLIGERVARELGWKTSEIARDPVLGTETFFYLTRHSTSYLALRQGMMHAANMLNVAETPALRTKIEFILHDSKTGIDP